MHLDPILINLAAVALLLVTVGALLRRLRQPSVLAYLVVGVLVGPHGLGLVSDVELLGRLGSIGVLLLLFFIGMEVPIPRLIKRWRLLVVGTAFQIGASLAATWALGVSLSWGYARIVLLGFVISLSSTAVVLALLREAGELDHRVGQLTTGVLLVQDVAVIPMLIVLGLLGGTTPSAAELGLQVVAAVFLVGVAVLSVRKQGRKLPFLGLVKGDRELELYAAFLACFALALVSGVLGLSAALGAFVAGIAVSAVDDKSWIAQRLDMVHVLLVGAFFIGVGAQIDLRFVLDNLVVVVLLVAGAIVTNTLINAVIFRAARAPWREALYGGALLSQIGEFSLVLAGVGLAASIIEPFAYQLTIAIISLSLLVTPLYIRVVRKLRGPLVLDPVDPTPATGAEEQTA